MQSKVKNLEFIHFLDFFSTEIDWTDSRLFAD